MSCSKYYYAKISRNLFINNRKISCKKENYQSESHLYLNSSKIQKLCIYIGQCHLCVTVKFSLVNVKVLSKTCVCVSNYGSNPLRINNKKIKFLDGNSNVNDNMAVSINLFLFSFFFRWNQSSLKPLI
jgi:hypothetical protein